VIKQWLGLFWVTPCHPVFKGLFIRNYRFSQFFINNIVNIYGPFKEVCVGDRVLGQYLGKV
jgi:hypothetical protein